MKRILERLLSGAGAPDHAPLGNAALLIKSIPAFATLQDAVVAQILEASQSAAYAPGARIVQQGDPSFDALVLLSGQVRILNENTHGQTLLATTQGPALLGEIGALAHLPRTATIVADSDAQVLRLPREALLAICRQVPEIFISVVARLGQHIQGVNSALGLYAGSLAALEREDVDPESLLHELQNPNEAMRDFAAAFQHLARHVASERRKRKEMASAALIQQAMLPQTLENLDPLRRCIVQGEMRPARDVGGDFYDAFMLDENRLALLIGDVCGKGVPASLFMSFSVTALRLVARQEPDIAAVLRRANALLYEQNAMSMFATVFYAVLDLSTNKLDYGTCGHNPPLLVHRNGETQFLEGGGTPLGILPERKAVAHSVQLHAGDCLLLYTDGIPESSDRAGVEYGEPRLEAALRRAIALADAHIPKFVADDVAAFAQGQEPFDDITAVAVRLH